MIYYCQANYYTPGNEPPLINKQKKTANIRLVDLGCQTCTSDHRAGNWLYGLCKGSWLGYGDSWPPVGADVCQDKRRDGPKERDSALKHFNGWMTMPWGKQQVSLSPAASCQDLAQCLVACCWGHRPSAPPLQSSWLGSCWEPFCPLGSEGIPYGTKPKRQHLQTRKYFPFFFLKNSLNMRLEVENKSFSK